MRRRGSCFGGCLSNDRRCSSGSLPTGRAFGWPHLMAHDHRRGHVEGQGQVHAQRLILRDSARDCGVGGLSRNFSCVGQPFQELTSLQREINNMFDSFFGTLEENLSAVLRPCTSCARIAVLSMATPPFGKPRCFRIHSTCTLFFG